MRLSRFLPALIAVLCAALPANGDDGPPLIDGWYVDIGACPFERCIYREWTITQDTVLYDAARGGIPVGAARASQTVEVVTGIVYTVPIPVEVVHPILLSGPDAFVSETTHILDQFSVGDRFFLLTYQGELFNLAWIDGEFDHLDIGQMRDLSKGYGIDHFQSCATPSYQCWWQIPQDRLRRQSEWWVEIRLPDGTIGWTNEVDHFGNKRQAG